MSVLYYLNSFIHKLKIAVVGFLLCALDCAYAQSLTVTGSNWSAPIVPIVEAGNNYSGSYQSEANQILLNVSVPLLLGQGRVSVRYEPNPVWDNNLGLSIRRTGNGTTLCVLCSLTGGDAYQPITTVDTELFRITAVLALASYSNIPIQLMLNGVSVLIPAANYNARVVFTIGAL